MKEAIYKGGCVCVWNIRYMDQSESEACQTTLGISKHRWIGMEQLISYYYKLFMECLYNGIEW